LSGRIIDVKTRRRRNERDPAAQPDRAVVERAGLAVAGAVCGTFVAAQLTSLNPALSDSIGFIAAMVLVGMIGFYLGIDVPRLRAVAGKSGDRGPRVDPIQLLSATGTFLVTVAALISLYAFVFDEAPQRGWG
jgi:hypothetical protein